ADPLKGWKVLLSLLREGGVMRVALYSELARRSIVAAREYCLQNNYGSSSEGIRVARQHLTNGAEHRSVTRYFDFFSTSACRDLLFHTQEHRFSIEQIQAFLEENNLRFFGFDVPASVRADFIRRFGNETRNFARWSSYEKEHPDTFVS